MKELCQGNANGRHVTCGLHIKFPMSNQRYVNEKKIAEESHTSGCYIFSFGSSYFTLPPAYVHNYTFINSQPGGGKPSEILPPTRHTSLPPISTISLCLRVRTAECKQVSLLQQLAASQPRILTASHPSSLWHPHRTAHPQRHLSRTRLK